MSGKIEEVVYKIYLIRSFFRSPIKSSWLENEKIFINEFTTEITRERVDRKSGNFMSRVSFD